MELDRQIDRSDRKMMFVLWRVRQKDKQKLDLVFLTDKQTEKKKLILCYEDRQIDRQTEIDVVLWNDRQIDRQKLMLCYGKNERH